MESIIVEQLQPGVGKQQIVCFPYLGGHAQVYKPLCSYLSKDFEVWAINPPGHGINQEPLLDDLKQMVDRYVHELLPVLKQDVILIGHSLGGIVAYFVAQQLKAVRGSSFREIRLILSACNCPEAFAGKLYSELPNDQLIDHLLAYGGLPEELLAERELLQFFMPMIRSDFRALQSSAELSFEPLDIPIYYLWGASDQTVDLSAVLQWSPYFASKIHMIPIKQGSHMFITEQAEEVANHIQKIVQSSVMHILN